MFYDICDVLYYQSLTLPQDRFNCKVWNIELAGWKWKLNRKENSQNLLITKFVFGSLTWFSATFYSQIIGLIKSHNTRLPSTIIKNLIKVCSAYPRCQNLTSKPQSRSQETSTVNTVNQRVFVGVIFIDKYWGRKSKRKKKEERE